MTFIRLDYTSILVVASNCVKTSREADIGSRGGKWAGQPGPA